MSSYKYTFQNYVPKEMARIAGRSLSISTKTSVDVAAFIRGKQIDKVIAYLEQVVVAKKAIPFKKHVKDIPHRKGMRTGRFPKKVSEHFIKLLKGLRSNAQDRGFDTSKMIIVHAVAQKGTIVSHYGRRRTERKNTHIEIIVKEVEKTQAKRKRLAGPRRSPTSAEVETKKKPKVEKKVETRPSAAPKAQLETKKVSVVPKEPKKETPKIETKPVEAKPEEKK